MTSLFDESPGGKNVQELEDPRTQQRASNEINAALTPGLIHEINNILTGIYFNLEGCREIFDASHPVSESLQEIQVGVERIKDVLGRITQIYLNKAEKEPSYHEAQALIGAQLDLVRIVFPKTARITLTSPEQLLHIHASEHSFRIALLTMACCLRGLYPDGKIEVPLSVLPPEQVSLVEFEGVPPEGDCVGFCFQLPCIARSAYEIDDFQAGSSYSDISMAAAEVLVREAGGLLLFAKGESVKASKVLMVFPCHNLNA
ncbi:MAG: hypothetical protein WCG66_01875 [bacterium]